MSEGRTDMPSADVAIRDAACLLVVDLRESEPKLLMGRRHADQVFLPNKWVFPGGRVDDDDRTLAHRFTGSFSPGDLADEIKPFALAAVRELFEETGLLIGRDGAWTASAQGWQSFAASGQMPAPGSLIPMARAITPPGRVRRYDTWFFVADSNALSGNHALPDGELLDLGWFTLPEAGTLDLPNITRLVLDDLALLLRSQQATKEHSEQLPFYYFDGSVYRRDLISCKVAPSVP